METINNHLPSFEELPTDIQNLIENATRYWKELGILADGARFTFFSLETTIGIKTIKDFFPHYPGTKTDSKDGTPRLKSTSPENHKAFINEFAEFIERYSSNVKVKKSEAIPISQTKLLLQPVTIPSIPNAIRNVFLQFSGNIKRLLPSH